MNTATKRILDIHKMALNEHRDSLREMAGLIVEMADHIDKLGRRVKHLESSNLPDDGK